MTSAIGRLLRSRKLLLLKEELLAPARNISTGHSALQRNNFINDERSDSDINISRYPVHNIKDLPVMTQELMYNVDDKSGFIPNLFHAMSYRPEQFKRFVQYKNAIMKREKSNLRKEDFELIGVATSAHFGCMYCVIAHSALHRSLSRNPYLADQVATSLSTAEVTPRQHAMLSLALAVSKCEPVTDEHFDELAKHGLNMDDAWDIAAMASFTAMANGMIRFLKVKPNREYYAMGR